MLILLVFPKPVCVHALKGLAQLCVSCSSEIALAHVRVACRLRSTVTLVAVPLAVLFAHAVVPKINSVGVDYPYFAGGTSTSIFGCVSAFLQCCERWASRTEQPEHSNVL